MMAFSGMIGVWELMVLLAVPAIVIIPFWTIFAKAGFSGALSLLMLIPLVNLVMLLYLAFAQWPALKETTD